MSSSSSLPEPSPAAAESSRPQGLLDAVVQRDERRDAIIVRLSGEIDSYTAATLREALTDAFDTHPGRRLLVVDLERVEFIGSQGLAELLVALDRAEHAGMTMRLAAANATVRMLLAVTGTNALLTLQPTVADALAEPPARP